MGSQRGAYVQREGRVPGVRFIEFSGDCCAEADGFTLHANVRVHGRKRKRLERLCRYMARPPIATKRLERLPDGRIRYRLRHAFHDGTRAILFEPCTFIEKLCALVPPPRANLVTYHGVLAPNAAWRARVVPPADSFGALPSRKKCQKIPLDETSAPEKARRYTWAELLKRVFKVDVLHCPFCKGRRRLIAFIT
ncbi:MAG: transposase [Planctomycetota bacterium]